jgi:hypothetical protein
LRQLGHASITNVAVIMIAEKAAYLIAGRGQLPAVATYSS